MVSRAFLLVTLFAMHVAAAAAARPSHPSKAVCKQVRNAVTAGRTLEQITAEFAVDAEEVMKCVQGRGKAKKPKAAKKSAPAHEKKRPVPAH